MADRLKEILREATDSVHVIWPEAAEIRRRADRRRNALRALAAAVAVVAVATALRVTVFQPASAPLRLDTPPTPCAGLDLSMPLSETEVKVVLTAQDPQAGPIGQEFKDRGFIVEHSFVDRESPKGRTVIRYGSAEVGDAWLVYAYFLREAHLVFEPTLRAGAVDVVIGGEFKQLATPSEARALIAIMGRPPEPVC